MITKDMLAERVRGKGGSVVRLRTPHPMWGDTVVVKDLMQRKGLTPFYANRIGVGPADRGVAFGVLLAEIAEIVRA